MEDSTLPGTTKARLAIEGRSYEGLRQGLYLDILFCRPVNNLYIYISILDGRSSACDCNEMEPDRSGGLPQAWPVCSILRPKNFH